MLEVVKNTYPTDLKPGDKVQWVYERGRYSLYKVPYKGIFDKSYFASPNCTKDGIKLNGMPVDLVGIIAQLKSRGWVLELRQV